MKILLNSISAAGLFAALATAQSGSYTLTDLGPAGTPFSQAAFVNNNGFVAGLATGSGGAQHSMLWYEGISGDIGGLGGTNSGAGGVNNSGLVVGGAETTSKDPNNENFCGYATGLQCLVYRWQNGVMTALPTLGGTNANWGSINNRGEMAGWAETSTRDPKCPQGPQANGVGPLVLDYEAVIWGPGPGQIRQLSPLAGDTVAAAFAVNDNGQSVGMSGTCANNQLPPVAAGAHAVLWEPDGAVLDLGNLGGAPNPALPGVGNVALFINNRSQVVGTSALPGSTTHHAFLWERATGMRGLGTLPGDVVSAGLSINNRGDVVGPSLDAMGNPRPWIWKNGVMTDLNTLVPSDAPLHLLLAVSINDHGQIAGFGVTNDGLLHGYLLTPAKSSSSGATGPTGTTAILTPTNLATSESSVTLDASASTSASGSLQYLFSVVPGGLQPALLQSPTDPKATVDFVNGPGLYLVQLTVTDDAGNSAKSLVAMLNYQPSTSQ